MKKRATARKRRAEEEAERGTVPAKKSVAKSASASQGNSAGMHVCFDTHALPLCLSVSLLRNKRTRMSLDVARCRLSLQPLVGYHCTVSLGRCVHYASDRSRACTEDRFDPTTRDHIDTQASWWPHRLPMSLSVKARSRLHCHPKSADRCFRKRAIPRQTSSTARSHSVAPRDQCWLFIGTVRAILLKEP